jgi:multiple sugar transport system permease protein
MKRYKYLPYVLLCFSIVLIVTFFIIPMLLSMEYSLKNYVLSKPDNIYFVGIRNYIKIFTDEAMRRTILNSAYIVIFMSVFCFLGSVLGGLFFNNIKKGRGVLLAILIIPWTLPPIVNGILWDNIISPSGGAINGILYKFGIIKNYIIFTRSPFITINIVAMIEIWRVLPFLTIMMLAALQAIPDDLYEAARLDGANSLKCFIHITFPSIMPTIAIILSLAAIGGLNLFDVLYSLARFRGDTRTLAMESYIKVFKYFDIGYGSTIAYILLILGAIFSIIYVKSLYEKVKI